MGGRGTVGIFYGLAVVAFFSSLERIPVPVFILIFYSYPIIVAVLSRILGERLTGMFWPAALLTLGGVALTVVTEGEEALVGALLAMGALFGCVSVCASLALKHLTAGLHIILFYSYPMLVALLSFALGERLPRVFWLVLLGTMSGVVMVIAPELLGAEMGEGIALGGALTLLSAFLFACYFQLSRRILRDTPDVLRAVAWSFVGALLALAALAIVTGLRMPGGRGFALLLGLALCSTVLSLVACNFGVQHLGAPRAALMTMATPFVTVVLAVILLNEFLSVPQLIGGTLILASMIVLARASDPQERHLRPQEAEVSTARP